MKKRYLLITTIFTLIFVLAVVPVSAASQNGKLQDPDSAGISKTLGQKTYNYDAYRYGSYLYYSYHGPYKGDVCTNYIYRMKTNGTGREQIGTVKKGQSGWISAIYGNNLIYATSDTGSGTYITSLNLKTKKKTYIKNFNANFQADYTLEKAAVEPYHYKNYFIAATATGAVMKRTVWVYNTKTNNFKVITKKGWGGAIKGKKVYYLESSGSNILLKTCSIKGKNKKILKKVKASKDPSVYMSSASGKYCIYTVDGKEYKYKYRK